MAGSAVAGHADGQVTVSGALSEVQRRRLLALLMRELRLAYATAISDGTPVWAAIEDIERRRHRLLSAGGIDEPIVELVADQTEGSDE